MVGISMTAYEREVLSPGGRRRALIQALEDQHKTDPGSYAQYNGSMCARATFRRAGLQRIDGTSARKSLGLNSIEYEDIFGGYPWEGTAQDAADRLRVIHNRKIGWLGRMLGKAA